MSLQKPRSLPTPYPAPPTQHTHPHTRACRSARQRYFTSTAAALLAIQLAGSSVYVAAVALELAQEDCSYPWSALAVLEFVRVRSRAADAELG